jgi:hypothetical protein
MIEREINNKGIEVPVQLSYREYYAVDVCVQLQYSPEQFLYEQGIKDIQKYIHWLFECDS